MVISIRYHTIGVMASSQLLLKKVHRIRVGLSGGLCSMAQWMLYGLKT
jgi:hypothetical protein